MGAAASTVKMWWLEPPARHKTGIDQHQRRALRRSLALGTTGNAMMRASGPLVALREAQFEPLCRRPAGHHRHSGQLHDMYSVLSDTCEMYS